MKRLSAAAIVLVSAAALLTGCAKVVEGKPVSSGANPFEVGGKPVTEGFTGLRPGAPGPMRPVVNGDGGEIDRISVMAIDDIEFFWHSAYGEPLEGKFTPVDALYSYDSRYKHGAWCGGPTSLDDPDGMGPNAAFCWSHEEMCPSVPNAPCGSSYNTIAWDRGIYFPSERAAFGTLGLALDLAHEYGHGISWVMAKLLKEEDADSAEVNLASEQQADCFAGVYIRWVADGNSPRFTMSTGEGLSTMLASQIYARDPLVSVSDPKLRGLIHGSAFERVTAFQIGFDDGTAGCVAITPEEIAKRRQNLPKDLLEQGDTGEATIGQDSVNAFVEALTKVFGPKDPPKVTFDAPSCPDARPTPPASYCPSTNTIAVDMPALVVMGTSLTRGSPIDLGSHALFGDYTAYSVLVSRFMLALEKQRGELSLDDTDAGLRTACLTGTATKSLAKEVTLSNGVTIKLTGGDLDEAVAGMLKNGVIAANVNGQYAPSAFARVDAFRAGVLGDENNCYDRWP
jgi:hypothetical protein